MSQDRWEAALQLIDDFGWLRVVDLGSAMFSLNPAIQGANVCSALERAKLVLKRTLPEKTGVAVVLTKAGATWLSERTGLPAKAIRWGNCSGGIFVPPASWKHELLVNQVLLEFKAIFFDVESEWHVKRCYGLRGTEKIPDALVSGLHGGWYWVEAEVAPKTGDQHMRKLAEHLIKASKGVSAIEKVTGAMVIFDTDAVDHRGYRIDHRGRVTSAIKKLTREDVQIRWVAAQRVGHRIHSMQISDEIIFADFPSRLLASASWSEADGTISGYVGNALVTVAKDDDGWRWHAYSWEESFGQRRKFDVGNGVCSTVTGAKRNAGVTIAMSMQNSS